MSKNDTKTNPSIYIYIYIHIYLATDPRRSISSVVVTTTTTPPWASRARPVRARRAHDLRRARKTCARLLLNFPFLPGTRF